MEEPVTPVPAEDPYDPGDTSLVMLPAPVLPEPAPEKPRNPDGTFAKPAPVHPDYLTRQAKEFGFEESDIAEMPTDALHRTVLQMAKNRLAFREQQETARAVQGDGPRPDPVVKPEPEPEPDELGDDFDPRLVKLLKAQAKELAELKKVKGLVDGINDRETKRETSRASELIDNHFEALGSEFGRIFGEGPAGELKDQGAMKRRIAVLNEAGVNLGNVTSKSLAKIKAAAELLYQAPSPVKATDPYAVAGKPVNGAKLRVSPEEWANAALAKPTQRTGAAEPKGEELAKANLAARFRAEDQVGDADVQDSLL